MAMTCDPEQRVARLQSLPKDRCPICGQELKYPATKLEREKSWRKHRRQHYDWGNNETKR